MAVRVLGHGMRLGVVQFIKGALHTSERDFLGAIANCDFVTMGDGYTWNTQNRDADMATARKGWNEARRMIESGEYQMVILDELNTVLKYEYLPLDEVLSVLNARPAMLHVVVTGRHAPDALIVVSNLIPMNLSDVKNYNAALPAVVEARAPTIWQRTAGIAAATRLPTTEVSSAAATPMLA